MSASRHPAVHLVAVILAVLVLHLVTARDSEPFYNNDETRHTLTGVFIADAVRDLPKPLTDPKGYAVRYYCQYPAVGVITWPPFFYLVEGVAMLALGPHFWVGRLCVAGFAVLALVYTYRWARMAFPPPPLRGRSVDAVNREGGGSKNPPPADTCGVADLPLRGGGVQAAHLLSLLAVALVALTPLVFVSSQRVMLEVPTLAMLLVSVTHFEKYLTARRGRDALLACLFAAFAALTRFDGVLVGLYFLIRLVSTRNLRVLLNRPVVYGVFLALLLTLPYYLVTWKVYGTGIGTAATAGTTPESTGFFHPANLSYYPATLPEQAGWPLAVAAVCGLFVTLVRYRHGSGPTFALLAAVYALFTPLAQQEWRHAIYWLPAVAVLACRLVQFAAETGGRIAAGCLAVVLLSAGVWEARGQAFRYVFGYDDAAKWVMANRTTDRPVLIDGELTASFVYHVRLRDPARKVWVVRGDKLLYAMFSDPTSSYKQFAHTEAEVLDRLETVDPEFVVIEDPPADFHRVAGAELLRETLRKHPERYELVTAIPLRTNYDKFADPGTRLVVFRKLHRNPHAANTVEIEVIGLGRTLGASR